MLDFLLDPWTTPYLMRTAIQSIVMTTEIIGVIIAAIGVAAWWTSRH